MKKIIIILVLFSSTFLFSQEISNEDNNSYLSKSILFRSLRINFQANLLNSFSIMDSSKTEKYFKNNSGAIGLEINVNPKSNLKYGFGILYQFPSSINSFNGKIGSVPIYSFLDYPIINNQNFPIKFSARLGFYFLKSQGNINKGQNGIYHSLGFTTELNKYTEFKLLYSNNYGVIKLKEKLYDFNNGNMNFVLSFKL